MKAFLASFSDSVRTALKSSPHSSAELPLFPLGSVLFPGGTLALKIFEQRYLDMAKSCLKNEAPFGVALIREGNEVGFPAVPETIGSLAYVTNWDMQDLGVLLLQVKGAERFKVLSKSVSKSGLIIGMVSVLPDDMHVDCPEHEACVAFLRKVYAQVKQADALQDARFGDAGWVGFRLTEMLPFNNAVKQKMLELTDARIRLEIIHQFLVDQRLIG